MKKRLILIALSIVFAVVFATNSFAQTVTPQGRLTLSSTAAVMTSDVVGASTIYYLPYVGNTVPIPSSGSLTNYSLPTSTPLSLTLTSGATVGNIFDIFITLKSGSPWLCSGPGWYTSTQRAPGGSTSGWSAITQLNGIWVNAQYIGCGNGSTGVDINAQTATYLGSYYIPRACFINRFGLKLATFA